MAIIVPKSQTRWNRERILISLIIILSLIIVFIVLTEMQRVRPSLVLEDSLQGMNDYYGTLSVQIIEEGSGYNLNFYGKMLRDKTVSGEIREYELEVYLNRYGELFIKDLIDGKWKAAADLELDALKEFLDIPFGMLDQSRDSFSEARFIQGNEKEHVIMLNLPPGLFVPSLAALEESRMECLLFIEEDTLFIYQISFFLYDNSDGKEKFRKTFIFNEMQDRRDKERDTEETRMVTGGTM